MKITGPTLKQGLEKALDWLDRQRFQVTESPEAAEICDLFDKAARRVPRNICADPAVEAKRAVSDSLKHGLSAIKKSVLNSLNEADETYLREFGSALKKAASEYLGLDLLFADFSDDTHRKIQISFTSKEESSRIQIRAKRQLALKDTVCMAMCIIPGKPGIIRAAADEDFERLIGKVRTKANAEADEMAI